MNKLPIGLFSAAIVVLLLSVVSCGDGKTEPEEITKTKTVVELAENNTNWKVGYSYIAYFDNGSMEPVERKDKCRWKVGTVIVYTDVEIDGEQYIKIISRTPPSLPPIDPETAQYSDATGNELGWFSQMEECEQKEWVCEQCRIMYAKGEISKEELDFCYRFVRHIEFVYVYRSAYDLIDTPYISWFDVPVIDLLRESIDEYRETGY